MASNAKDDKLEKLFRDLTMSTLTEGRETASLIIQLGGEIL
ncbi:MAG: hypothetical protein SCK29_04820 [Bacillota bacterium]|nr:hypothetical protein [Bacillota bacterium]